MRRKLVFAAGRRPTHDTALDARMTRNASQRSIGSSLSTANSMTPLSSLIFKSSVKLQKFTLYFSDRINNNQLGIVLAQRADGSAAEHQDDVTLTRE